MPSMNVERNRKVREDAVWMGMEARRFAASPTLRPNPSHEGGPPRHQLVAISPVRFRHKKRKMIKLMACGSENRGETEISTNKRELGPPGPRNCRYSM